MWAQCKTYCWPFVFLYFPQRVSELWALYETHHWLLSPLLASRKYVNCELSVEPIPDHFPSLLSSRLWVNYDLCMKLIIDYSFPLLTSRKYVGCGISAKPIADPLFPFSRKCVNCKLSVDFWLLSFPSLLKAVSELWSLYETHYWLLLSHSPILASRLWVYCELNAKPITDHFPLSISPPGNDESIGKLQRKRTGICVSVDYTVFIQETGVGCECFCGLHITTIVGHFSPVHQLAMM